MKTKHTPGPWLASGKGGTHDGGSSKQHPCFRGSIDAGLSDIVQFGCFLGVQGRTPKEAEANARLIAAAPELLEALRLHLEFLKSLPRGWLGKTSGDVGALNDAYLAGNRALAKVEGKQ